MGKKKQSPSPKTNATTTQEKPKPRPKRTYCLEATLYPDDPKLPEYFARLRKLIENEGLDWSCVLHDRDLKEDGSGEFKDEHFHFLVRYHNPVTLSRLTLDTGIPVNYVKAKSHLQSTVRYHIHLDHPEKAQYSPAEVYGTLGHWLVREIPIESDGSGYRFTDDLLCCIEIAEATGLANGSVADMLRSIAVGELLKPYKDFSASVMAVYREAKERFRSGRRQEEWEQERREILERKRLLQEQQCTIDRSIRRDYYGQDW